MPKKVIESLIPESFPYFPVISMNKNTRVITKHFTNTVLYLPSAQSSLLTWLIYQSLVDNSFIYEDRLLVRYSAATIEARNLYNSKSSSPTDIKLVREALKALIKSGYILPTSTKSIFIINPMLTYRSKYLTNREYKEVCENYQGIKDAAKFADNYINIIKSKRK